MKKILHLTIATIFCTNAVALAQAPALGAAASFALFTTAGAITNTATTHITGNIGLLTGAITGFGNINGNLHSGDLTATAASASVASTYLFLNNAIPTDTLAPLLGNDDTLSAGIYVISGNTTLSDTLYLDGLANPSSVFIFQIQGPLSSLSSTTVVLLNDAQACNVYWKVEGMISLASATTMKGTMVANNAAIDMASGVSLEGRALSTAGAITLNSSLVYTPVGCGSPYLTGPVAPVMGTANCYALFSANGPVTNNGITTAIGDIGTNVGLTTGYDALLVTGTIHPIPDGSTNACAADLLVAYNNLNVLAHDIELLYPAQFGNSLVLTPHTYLLDAATALTDTITLNGEGNADAVFVIKINGALSTSTFAFVKLINGTLAKNVFWKVEGAASISDFAQFKGTIIVNNGAINIATGAVLEGRALTTDGALSTQAITANMPDGCTTPLGIHWLSFTGKYSNQNAILNWKIADEEVAYFEVEKSLHGKDFAIINKVAAKQDMPQANNNYTYTDYLPSASAYYRIAIINKAGKREYSSVIKLQSKITNTDLSVILSPNPVAHTLNVAFPNEIVGENVSINIYNMLGTKMLEAPLALLSNKLDIDFPNGIYVYHIYQNAELVKSGKVVVKN